MRILDWLRGHHTAEAEDDQADAARRAFAAAELWLAETEAALEAARLTTAMRGLPAGIDLHNDEKAYLCFSGAYLIESHPEPSRWVMPSEGISLWLAKGSAYRGGHDDDAVIDLHLSVADRGTFVVTSQRCLFVGGGTTVNWAHADLVGFSLEGRGQASFTVRNRHTTTGAFYGPAYESIVDAVVAAAIARFQGQEVHTELIRELETEVANAASALRALPRASLDDQDGRGR